MLRISPDFKKYTSRLIVFNLLGIKTLLVFLAVLLSQPLVLLLSYFADLAHGFYQLYNDYRERDLSDAKVDSAAEDTRRIADDFDVLAREQKAFRAQRERDEVSLSLLNKLLAESEIRQGDLLALADTSSYYQLFVYSSPLTSIINRLGIEGLGILKREYPVFLADLGFARMGRSNSPLFLIKKSHLKEEKLRNIKEFKKFLMYHLKRIRESEWNIFLERVRELSEEAYQQARALDFRKVGALQINFLLTETRMNVTHIGYVDGDRLGLGDKFNKDDINREIFASSDSSEKPETDEELKVKIRRVIRKQDVSLLLTGVLMADKHLIESEQDSLRENLRIESVLGYSGVAQDDLVAELIRIGIEEDSAPSIATGMIARAQQYTDALANLRISID